MPQQCNTIISINKKSYSTFAPVFAKGYDSARKYFRLRENYTFDPLKDHAIQDSKVFGTECPHAVNGQ